MIRRTIRSSIIGSSVALLSMPSTAIAQNSNRPPVCWRPNALASCRSWIVFESSAEARFASSRSYRYDASGRPYTLEDPLRVALTGGAMINISETKAIGLTATTTSNYSYRVEGRLRHWEGDLGVDLSAGVTGFAPSPNVWVRNPNENGWAGFTGSIGISRRYIGADIRIDAVRTSVGRYERESFVTLRTGSWAGLAAMPLVLLISAFQAMD
jgi:hypothetical protein